MELILLLVVLLECIFSGVVGIIILAFLCAMCWTIKKISDYIKDQKKATNTN